MNSAVARALYHALQLWRGEPVLAAMRDLRESRAWPREKLFMMQWERQKALYRHAFTTVPHYRDSWTKLGLTSASMTSREAWSRLPVLEKADLHQKSADLKSSRRYGGLASSTSGSSGTPVAVFRSHKSWAYHHANIFRGWEWFGIQVGDPYAYLWGLALDSEGKRQAWMKDGVFNRRRCSAFSLDRDRAVAFFHELRAHPVEFLYGYPSAVAQFAEELAAAGLDGRELRVKAAVTTAEVLKEHQRARIGEVFGCPVVNSYGCAEVGIVGIECEQGRLHIPIESVVVETLPGSDGYDEVLLTDLMNEAQPVIRYRIGDLVKREEDTCPCGRGLPVLGQILGRAGDTLELPDGRKINANLPSYIFKKHGKAGTVREYQFVQFRDGTIELRIIRGPAWTNNLVHEIGVEAREVLGVDVAVSPVDRIERVGRGKHRDFVRAE
ncbi:MAG: phenylacetate--CoA ligase family protein [Candidatus Eisenbacteria bacterium]|uniref:Phenylacetate--CoA ligase family protein n=1 Tax=Eiseniibacteriota bacterium TaxID=2212470 RepID=A0A849SRY5_UNCEI|nr:phenylacetate--CoA ligase family protein [Candidatus Eisenbacteria bacterium]